MADKYINARIQNRRDTLANWEKANPVLLNGETVLVDVDTGIRAKTGDGKTAFKSLAYDDQYIQGLLDEQKSELSADIKEVSDELGSHTHSYSSLELNTDGSLSNGGFIDFHYKGSTADYTTRIIENTSGHLNLTGGLTVTKDLTVNGTITGELSGLDDAISSYVDGHASDSSAHASVISSAISTHNTSTSAHSSLITSKISAHNTATDAHADVIEQAVDTGIGTHNASSTAHSAQISSAVSSGISSHNSDGNAHADTIASAIEESMSAHEESTTAHTSVMAEKISAHNSASDAHSTAISNAVTSGISTHNSSSSAHSTLIANKISAHNTAADAHADAIADAVSDGVATHDASTSAHSSLLASTISTHNTSTSAHTNMGWLTSEDKVLSSATAFDADTFGGHDVSYFATQAYAETKMDINQGVSNAGKVMVVDDYGNLTVGSTFTISYCKLSSFVIESSTAGSTKKFKITIDDNGVLSAVESSDSDPVLGVGVIGQMILA